MTRLDNDEKATKRRRRETIRRKHKRLSTLYERYQKAWADYQDHNTQTVPDSLIEKVVDVTTKIANGGPMIAAIGKDRLILLYRNYLNDAFVLSGALGACSV